MCEQRGWEALPGDEMLAGISGRWNSKSRLKCCSYYDLRGLSSFRRYAAGITAERITGSINQGNGDNKSMWDHGEGKTKQLRSPQQAAAQQQALSPSQASPKLCLGRNLGSLQVQSTLFFPQTAQGHARRACGPYKPLQGCGGANSIFGVASSYPLKPQSDLARFCSGRVY